MSDIKQVIVMRKKFDFPDGTSRKLRTGKMIAQGAHASLKVILDSMDRKNLGDTREILETSYDYGSPMDEWINGQFTKICLSVNSEEELDALYAKAQELNLQCALIVDSGKTEFNGVPTKTCIAIGPTHSELIDEVTGELPLL